MDKLFVAYGDNVMIEKLETIGNTAKGKVLSSNYSDLNYGDIILYQDNEWNEINIDEHRIVDIIWRPKIRAILNEKKQT